MNIDKSSDNQNQICEADMRLSLTGPEHLESPTTVPRLPACMELRHAVTTAVGRDGATAQPVVHRRRLSQQTRSDKTPTCKASVW